MTDPKPPHPGRAIEDAAVALDLEAAEVAFAIGISKSEFMQIVRGKAGIPPELAPRLAAAIGGTAEGWQQLQDAYDAARPRRRA